jgi:hypothetical protein
MDSAIVIHGNILDRQFVSNEPIPDVHGPAELIVYPKDDAKTIRPGRSMFEFFGKAPQLRSAEDIDAQVREEREAW